MGADGATRRHERPRVHAGAVSQAWQPVWLAGAMPITSGVEGETPLLAHLDRFQSGRIERCVDAIPGNAGHGPGVRHPYDLVHPARGLPASW